jgi:hypothetical protein
MGGGISLVNKAGCLPNAILAQAVRNVLQPIAMTCTNRDHNDREQNGGEYKQVNHSDADDADALGTGRPSGAGRQTRRPMD